MEPQAYDVNTEAYAKCIEGSKRIRWDIDKDVLQGREFDFSKKFLPDGISKVDEHGKRISLEMILDDTDSLEKGDYRRHLDTVKRESSGSFGTLGDLLKDKL